MGVRIQELPETTGINKEDVLIVEDGQGTKKGTVQQLDEALGVSQLKEDLSELEYLTHNRLSVGEIEESKYILPNGKTDNSADSFITGYIKVSSGKSVFVDGAYLEGNRSICIYDYNKKFIPDAIYNTSVTSIEVAIPINGYYIRITGKIGTELIVDEKRNIIEDDLPKLENSLQPLFSKTIFPIKQYNGLYFYPDGNFKIDINTTTSYLFKVENNSVVIAKGVYGESTRSICAFDSNGDFVKEIIKPSGDQTNIELRIIVDGFEYIGLSTTAGNTLVVEYETKYNTLSDKTLEKLSCNDYVGNYLKSDFAIITKSFGSGYIYYENGIQKVVSDSEHMYSGNIEVYENQDIELSCGFAPNGQIAHFYDETSKYVKSINIPTVGEYTTPITITVPFNVKYMRLNISKSQSDAFDIRYVNPIHRNYFASSIVNGWYNSAFKKIGNLFEKANKPIITFIDDDTINAESVQRYHDACLNAGIKGGYACITSNLDANEGLAELLKSYEREGFHVTYHCHTQSAFYRINDRDSVALENDVVTGLQKMKSYGFVDYNQWCTPYGVSDEEIQNLAQKWGLECIVTSGGSSYETTEAKRGRFGLERMSFEPTDKDGGFNLSDIKNVILEASKNNGWVLITTHFSSWTQDGFARFKELVDYAKDNDFEVKTLNEAWRIRKPIYEFYEMF